MVALEGPGEFIFGQFWAEESDGVKEMSLAECLEDAAEALPGDAEQIRPANGDPFQLLDLLAPDAGRRVLGWLMSNHPDEGVELATAWLEDEEGAQFLVGLSEEGLSKTGRKALRKLSHQVRSRGIEWPEAGVSEPHVGRLPVLDEKISMAYVSPCDPRGGRLVYIVESNPAGGARVFEALLDMERGIVDFQVYRAGRRQVGEFVRDLKRRPRFAAVEAAPDSVRELIRRQLAAHSADRPLPKQFSEWRGKLGLDDSGEPTPGELVREELVGDVDDAALEALGELARQGEVGPWPPAGLDRVMASLHEEFSGPAADVGALSQRVSEEVKALYLEDTAAVANADRFEETAYVWWRDGREDLARACLATARGLRAPMKREPTSVLTAIMENVAKALTTDLEKKLGWGGTEDSLAERATEQP